MNLGYPEGATPIDPDEDEAGAVRQRYIAALRAADRKDHGPLIAFVRTAL